MWPMCDHLRMPNVTVAAELIAKPGKEEELKSAALALIEPTRREEGCVQYDLHQSDTDPARLLFVENWRSKELLDRHLGSPHLRAFAAACQDLLAEPMRVMTYVRIA